MWEYEQLPCYSLLVRMKTREGDRNDNRRCGDGICGSALVISVKLQERLWSWIYHFSIHYGKRCTSFETRTGDGFSHSLFNGSHSESLAGTDVSPRTKRHGVVLHPPPALVEVNLCRHVIVQKAIVLETLRRQRAKVKDMTKGLSFLMWTQRSRSKPMKTWLK